MIENVITLPYETTEDIDAAARFVAALVPHGVTFHAAVVGHKMLVTLTGGY